MISHTSSQLQIRKDRSAVNTIAIVFFMSTGCVRKCTGIRGTYKKLGTQIFQSRNSVQTTAARNANDQSLQLRFISGLRNDIWRFVSARDPNTLEEQNLKLNEIASNERSSLSAQAKESAVISALTEGHRQIECRKRLADQRSLDSPVFEGQLEVEVKFPVPRAFNLSINDVLAFPIRPLTITIQPIAPCKVVIHMLHKAIAVNELSTFKRELRFQQGGATCYTARATIDLLKDTFGDRLISRFGPVNWPPRSCDLTPLDYFLWGYVKSLVYADKPQTLDHLENNICLVIADIRLQMLEKVIENWTSRLDYIRACRGSHMPEIIFKM
ncbi:putative DD41D transposase [Trichonephila clavipes]|nr:putative DD41D transposase [Trichonephila clavipes]